MKSHRWMAVVTAFLLLVPFLSHSPAQDPAQFVPGQLLVKFKANASNAKRKSILAQRGGRLLGTLDGINVSVVEIPRNTSPSSAAAGFAGEAQVEFAEPNYILYALDHPNGDYPVNDPKFVDQYGPKKIQAPGAWQTIANSDTGDPKSPGPATSSVNVAICDTGVDASHEDLRGKVIASIDFSGSSSADDRVGHGTHVAGIAAAATNNGTGVAGVGFSANIINVKVLDDQGFGSTSGIAGGIRWAADNGADVINLSLGSSAASTTLRSAVDYAWGKGVIIVAAAGNGGNTTKFYPAAYDNAIAVAATDANDRLASFSTRGDWVDIAAPGVEILSTLPNRPNLIGPQNYGNVSGTSMSSPHVAGVVALVAAFFPDKDAAFIRRQVTASADALTGLNIAGGRANAHNALKELGPPPPPPPSPTLNVRVSTNKSTYRFGELIIISVTVTSSSDGTPVSAANVALEIKTPSGGTFVGSGRTNSQGRYTTLGVASRSDGAGTYTVTATASKTGFNNGTGSATFTVR